MNINWPNYVAWLLKIKKRKGEIVQKPHVAPERTSDSLIPPPIDNSCKWAYHSIAPGKQKAGCGFLCPCLGGPTWQRGSPRDSGLGNRRIPRITHFAGFPKKNHRKCILDLLSTNSQILCPVCATNTSIHFWAIFLTFWAFFSENFYFGHNRCSKRRIHDRTSARDPFLTDKTGVLGNAGSALNSAVQKPV